MKELNFANLKNAYEKNAEEILSDAKLGIKRIENKSMSIDKFMSIINNEILLEIEKMKNNIKFLYQLDLINCADRFVLKCIVNELEEELDKIIKNLK